MWHKTISILFQLGVPTSFAPARLGTADGKVETDATSIPECFYQFYLFIKCMWTWSIKFSWQNFGKESAPLLLWFLDVRQFGIVCLLIKNSWSSSSNIGLYLAIIPKVYRSVLGFRRILIINDLTIKIREKVFCKIPRFFDSVPLIVK